MPKINLLYVITKLELGGAQKQLLSLINGLNKEKYNVFLFTAEDGLLLNEAQAIARVTLKRSRFLERPINPLKDVLALLELYNFIKINKIQIVHTHSSKAGILGRLAAKFAKIKVIIHTVHGWSFHDYQGALIKRFYLFLESLCAGFTAKIIVVSDFDKDKGLKNSVGREKQYSLIRYGINRNEFKNRDGRDQARRSLGLSDTDLAIGTVACFKPQKSPLDFIRLAGAIKDNFPDAKFIMIGDGPLRNKLCALAGKLNLGNRLALAGWRNDIPLVLCALDIFVLTSLWEGLPIAVLEAMAAGVPVVATDTGGIKEAVLDDKTGYVVRIGDIGSMQNRVEELSRNVQKRNEFTSSSRAVIDTEKFSLSNMLKSTEEVYSSLWEGSRHA